MCLTQPSDQSKKLETRMNRCMEGMVKETSQEAVKRIRADLSSTFKNPGDKDQYEHVQAVKTSIDEVIMAVDAMDLEKVKEYLEQGKSLIAAMNFSVLNLFNSRAD